MWCSADDWDCLCAYLAALTGGALSTADRAAALTALSSDKGESDRPKRCWTAEDELHRACDALAAAKLSEEEAAAVYAILRLLLFGALAHAVAVSYSRAIRLGAVCMR